MAKLKKPMRVKAKLPWKKVKVSEDLLNSEQFDGLVDIQVLTSYDLVEDGSESEDNSVEERKAKKRKKIQCKSELPGEENGPLVKTMRTENGDDSISEDKTDDPSVSSKKSTKKKNKKKGKCEEEDVDSNLSVSENETVDPPADLKKSKNNKNKRKNNTDKNTDMELSSSDCSRGEILTHENVEIVTDVVHSEVPEVTRSKSKSKKNKDRKKKKKLANKIKQSKDTATGNDEEINDIQGALGEEITNTEELDMSQWSNLCVPEPIMRALTKQRFENPTVIQSLALPSAIRDRRDILGAAETGSGKTLAFGIPVLAKILSIKKEQFQRESEEKLREVEMEVADSLVAQGDSEDFKVEGIDEEDIVEDDEEEVEDNEEEVDDDEEEVDDDEEEVEDDEEKVVDEEVDDDEEEVDDDEEEVDDDEEEAKDEIDDDDEDADQKEIRYQEAKIDRPPMALILEPTRELAVQVKKHMMTVAEFTDIQFVTVVGGMSIDKQRRILARKPEVVIATPGRLWQLIEEDNAHLRQIDMVHCLVVDEADRMVEKGHYEELTKLLELMNNSKRRLKGRQTFVMSATLTMDVSAPKRLNNKKKKVFNEDKLKGLTERICVGIKPKVIDLTPKDKVAQTLTELRVNCKAEEKDLYLYYFLCQYPGRTLVFVNSKDCLRRLNALFTLLQCFPLPLHADMHQRQRLKNLDKFAENSKGLLMASDVAARGLDIPKVDHVIHYQVPRTMENYVHRSGRTARASNLGVSLMLVGPEEARDYRKIVQGVRNGEDLDIMTIEMELFPAVKARVGLARQIDVKEYRIKKKKMKNNFFQKAAEEMDMIIDDKYLLEDLGDHVEQSDDKIQLKQMKANLTAILHGSLQPTRMSKYPTKSGQLEQKKAVKLHTSR